MHAINVKAEWLRHSAVAILYFFASTALLHASFSFWQLAAGLRLACLLLLPYRYWPAMALGEMGSMGQVSYVCYTQFGMFYALVNLIPRSIVAMPIVHWCRQRLSVVGPKRQIRMNVLTSCMFIVSLVLASFNFATVAAAMTWFVAVSPTQVPAPIDLLPRYFLGQYLGTLTIVPVVLSLWQTTYESHWRLWWTRLCASRLAIEILAVEVPVLALLMWAAHAHAAGDFGDIARMSMFLPVAGLAIRHGWRGAALGGTLASFALIAVMPSSGGPGWSHPVTLQSEVFLAFAITTLLILGAHIASLNVHQEKERIDGQLAVKAAQRSIYLSEIRMQRAADAIDQIGLSIQHTHERLLRNLRRFMPNFNESGLTKQALVTRQKVFRLAEGIYPRVWMDRGLPMTLSHGPVAGAFDSEDAVYSCAITGCDLSMFSQHMQLALYRMTCDAAVLLYSQATLSSVHLRIRTGTTRGSRWIGVRLEGEHAPDTDESPNLRPSPSECDEFSQRLGAAGQGVDELREQARIYGGTVSVRSVSNGTRIAMLLCDVEVLSGELIRHRH